MKKIALAIFVLLIVLMSGMLVSCSKEQPPHTHHFGEWIITQDSTCLIEGEMIRYCDCGEKQVETVKLSDHTIVTVKGITPTCQNEGLTDGEKCSVCDKTIVEQNKIPVSDHTIITINGVKPTCQSTGLTDGEKCSVCDEVFVKQEIIPTSDHAIVTIEGTFPTCQSTGLTDGEKCSVCDKIFVEQEIIPALDHLPEEAVSENIIDASCSSDGSYDSVVYCHYCDLELSRNKITIEKGSHIPADTVMENIVSSTCSTNGSYENVVYCSVCGVEISRTKKVVDKLSHTYVNEICSVCGYTESELGMKFELSNDGTYYSLVGLGTCKKTEIVIPSQYNGLPVKKIKSYAITNGNITNVIIPDSITYIAQNAFLGCDSLTSIVIPDSVIDIDAYAFDICTALTIYCEAKIQPESYLSGWNLFYFDSYHNLGPYRIPVVWDCKNNDCADDGRYYTVVDGIRYSIDVENDYAEVAGQPKNIKEGVIQSNITFGDDMFTVKYIEDGAFYGCENITRLYVLKSVINYDVFTVNISGWSYTFRYCDALTIYFEDTVENTELFDEDLNTFTLVTSIYVVPNCKNNENVWHSNKIQNAVSVVIDDIHYYINKNDNYAIVIGQPMKMPSVITIPSEIVHNSVTYEVRAIYQAFKCYSIDVVIIPVSVTEIIVGAFDYYDLPDICYLGTREQWDNIYFSSAHPYISGEEYKERCEVHLQCDYVL